MKNIIRDCLIVSLLYYLLASPFVIAQTTTSTPTASTSPTVIDKDIQQLKDKIANKVSEIRRENNKAVSGFVISNDGNTMMINNSEANQVKFDDTLTKYFQILGAQKKEIKADDIKKNDYAIVTGVQTDKTIAANVVLIDENFLVDSGKITEVNKDSYNIKVSTSDKNTYSLDIETYTKQFMINIKTLEMEKIGFSKFKEGDTLLLKKPVTKKIATIQP